METPGRRRWNSSRPTRPGRSSHAGGQVSPRREDRRGRLRRGLEGLRPGIAAGRGRQDAQARAAAIRPSGSWPRLVGWPGLKHPGVVPVFDVGREGDSCFIVSGWSRAAAWPTASPRTARQPQEAVRLVAEVAETLAYAHRQGFVHRDCQTGQHPDRPARQGAAGRLRHRPFPRRRCRERGRLVRHPGLHESRTGSGPGRRSPEPTSTAWASSCTNC